MNARTAKVDAVPPLRRPSTAMITIDRDRATIAVLIGASLFNFLLCIVNANLMTTTESVVMACEVALIGSAVVLAMDRRGSFLLLLLVYLAYMAFILALRPFLDLKAIRDFLIPLTFYVLGRNHGDPRSVDKVMFGLGVVFVVFGALEYFFTTHYLTVVNILKYYLARGTLAEVPEFMAGGPQLFASGLRFEDRNLLGFLLSPHRVSSIFLEPVSAGNFGGVLYIWALSRRDMRRRYATMALGMAAIVLSDARFGFYACLLVTPLAVLAPHLPRWLWVTAPFAAMAIIATIGYQSAVQNWTDDFSGRLLLAGLLFRRLDAAGIFGISPVDPGLADSGYAYTLYRVGLIGVVALWGLLFASPTRDSSGWRFKTMATAFVLLSLTVSNSIWSIKVGALLWWAIGTLDRLSPDRREAASSDDAAPIARPRAAAGGDQPAPVPANPARR